MEFYAVDKGNYEWCEKTKAQVANCKHYIGGYSFSAPLDSFKKWGLVDRKVSIMAYSGIRKNKNKGWIDRDSYQRSLAYLYTREPVERLPEDFPYKDFPPDGGPLPFNQRRIIPDKKQDQKALSFSFFYNPSANNIVEHFKARRLKLKHNRFTKSLLKAGRGTVEMILMDEKGRVLKQGSKEIRAVFPHKMSLKLIPKEGSAPIPDILLKTTPFSVVFPIPDEIYYKSGGKTLSVLVRAIDEKGNVKEQIIKEPKDKRWEKRLYF